MSTLLFLTAIVVIAALAPVFGKDTRTPELLAQR